MSHSAYQPNGEQSDIRSGSRTQEHSEKMPSNGGLYGCSVIAAAGKKSEFRVDVAESPDTVRDRLRKKSNTWRPVMSPTLLPPRVTSPPYPYLRRGTW